MKRREFDCEAPRPAYSTQHPPITSQSPVNHQLIVSLRPIAVWESQKVCVILPNSTVKNHPTCLVHWGLCCIVVWYKVIQTESASSYGFDCVTWHSTCPYVSGPTWQAEEKWTPSQFCCQCLSVRRRWLALNRQNNKHTSRHEIDN